jgi:hypothetical protein
LPLGLALVELLQVIPKGPLQLAIGLGLAHGRVHQPHPEPATEALEQFAPEGRAVVKQHGFRNHLPLTYGGNQSRDNRVPRRLEDQITEDVGSRIVVLQGQLIGSVVEIRQGHFF